MYTFLRTSVGTTLLAASLAASSASADLLDAVDSALANHPAIQSAIAESDASVSDRRAVFGALLPQVSVEADLGRETVNNATTRARNTGGIENGASVEANRRTGALTITQQILNLGNVARLDAADHSSKAASLQVNEVREEITLQAVSAYLSVMRAEELVALARANVLRHEATFKDVAVQVGRGVLTDADAAQALGRLALAQTVLIERETDQLEAEATYIEVIGVEPTELQTFKSGDLNLPADLDAAIVRAVRNNWALQSLDATRLASSSNADAARSDYFPTVDLEVSGNSEIDTGGSFTSDRTVSALLVMRFDLYAGGTDTAEYKAALERLRGARSAIDEQRRLVEESTRNAYNEYLASQRVFNLLELRLEASERVVAAYKQQFLLGLRTLLDMLDVENELFQARSAFVDGEYALTLRQLELVRELSGLGDAMTTIESSGPFQDLIDARTWANEEIISPADDLVTPPPAINDLLPSGDGVLDPSQTIQPPGATSSLDLEQRQGAASEEFSSKLALALSVARSGPRPAAVAVEPEPRQSALDVEPTPVPTPETGASESVGAVSIGADAEAAAAYVSAQDGSESHSAADVVAGVDPAEQTAVEPVLEPTIDEMIEGDTVSYAAEPMVAPEPAADPLPANDFVAGRDVSAPASEALAVVEEVVQPVAEADPNGFEAQVSDAPVPQIFSTVVSFD